MKYLGSGILSSVPEIELKLAFLSSFDIQPKTFYKINNCGLDVCDISLGCACVLGGMGGISVNHLVGHWAFLLQAETLKQSSNHKSDFGLAIYPQSINPNVICWLFFIWIHQLVKVVTKISQTYTRWIGTKCTANRHSSQMKRFKGLRIPAFSLCYMKLNT